MRRFISAISILFFFAFSAGPALAGPTGPGQQPHRPVVAGKVELEVLVVHATNSHAHVSPRVTEHRRYLKHLAYTGYSLVTDHTLVLTANKVERFELEGGRKVIVELLERDERRARLRIQIMAAKGGGKLLDTTMSVSRNASVIVAGPRYLDGILVLPLTARY